jgi:hypothetical protein
MTHPAIEAVARAICWSNGMNPDLTLGGDGVNFLWHEYIPQAERAIRALLDVPVSEAMVDAASLSLDGFITKKEASKIFPAMLSQLVREIEGEG